MLELHSLDSSLTESSFSGFFTFLNVLYILTTAFLRESDFWRVISFRCSSFYRSLSFSAKVSLMMLMSGTGF